MIPLWIKLARAVKADTSVCWPWPGKRNRDGYGMISHGGKDLLAHRAALELPVGGVVMHLCDNPPCVNPRHLHIGTHADNVQDTRAKGRLFHQRKTHCVNGHPLKGDNLYPSKHGYRVCATCARAAATRARKKRLE